MKLFETKKNMNEPQINEKHNDSNAELSSYGNINSEKSLFLKRSNYGWDGDY